MKRETEKVPAPRRRTGAGEILRLISSGSAVTRTSLGEATGLSRPTITQRLDLLLAAGLVHETDQNTSSGGRPSRTLAFNANAGVILCADIGEDLTRIALTDLHGRVLTDQVGGLPIDEGPTVNLDRIAHAAKDLLSKVNRKVEDVVGVGIGLPAPVDHAAGRTVGWSIMAGWDGYDIQGHLRSQLTGDVPILIDNDVNLLTIAEHRQHWADTSHLLFVKAGTGIGSGLVVDGRINRGSLGAAGDIGHARLRGYGDPECRCGNRGCLEALVGGWALARDLQNSIGFEPTIHDARDVVALVARGDSDAVRLLRDAGRILGEAIAYATSLLNPTVIVVGGMLAGSGDHLIAGVRELVYQRALPLATRQLRISPALVGARGGVIGAAHLVIDHVLDPRVIEKRLLNL